jgi:hypothetical protein
MDDGRSRSLAIPIRKPLLTLTSSRGDKTGLKEKV